MSKVLQNKAGVVRIDLEMLRLAREKERQHKAMKPQDKILECKADLAQVDQAILELARENGRNCPAMSFSDTVQKAVADHPGLGRRKRALEDFITCAILEMEMQTGGAAA